MDEAIRLLPHQWEAINSEKKFTGLVGGIGSGKTFLGACWVVKKTKENPYSLGLITANTYGQLQKATLPPVFNLLDDLKIPFRYNQNKSILKIGAKKRFLCLSAENYDNHRGIEIGEWWGDEFARYKLEAFQMFCGRMRDKKGTLSFLGSTSPDGLNWVRDYFDPTGERHRPDMYVQIRAKTTDNHHLPPDYADLLRSQFDNKTALQELDGEYIDTASGQVYDMLTPENIQEYKFNRSYPFIVGMDFNVNPMTAVFLQVIGNKVYAFDEVYLQNSNTYLMAQKLKELYGACRIIPDSTGNQRKSSSQRTDHQILKDEGHEVEIYLNPHVHDRQNIVNGLLYHKTLIISPKCKMLLKDMRTLSHNNKDKMLGHISDALGYPLCKLYPIQRPWTYKQGNRYAI